MKERLPQTPYREHPAVNHGGPCKKLYVVVHDTEGGTTRSIEAYFATGKAGGEGDGAHVIVDNKEIVQIAPLSALLYHAPGGNTNGIGFEHCGFASLSRLQWLKKRKMLTLSARRVAWLCYVNGWGVPKRGKNVFAHGDFPPPNFHTDPGPNFPWRLYMRLCRRAYAKLVRTYGFRWR
jgi:N-acetylmuramoyl-L-alanine amidase CwlA